MKSQVKYFETQLSILLITLSSQIFKICFTAKARQAFDKHLCKFIDSLAQHFVQLAAGNLVMEIRKSIKLNRLPLMSFGCFHSRDSQLDSKCSFFPKYYFCSRNNSVSSSRLAENSTGNCSHDNAEKYSKLAP